MEVQDAIPIALRAAYLALHRRSDAKFAEHGVTADQFVLLAMLARGQALTQRELALRMSSDPSTVRAMLVLLERQGWVRRDAHPSDGRARTVGLTTSGQQKFRDVWTAGESIRAELVSDLSDKEAAELERLLRQVTRSLSREDSVARAVAS